jgi:deferrochelatase/peroxidase EfeB
MLPTFVIGLREGLEAALIVGIIAAFLGQQGRKDALCQVWIGTAAAVAICVGVAIVLHRGLAFRAAQEAAAGRRRPGHRPAGRLVGEETEPLAPPVDTGEAVGSPVSRLTITIGYGPSLFDHRFGLAAWKPSALQSLADDALNEYIHHTGSAVFACPPGLRPGQHWGETLFS